MSRVFEHQLALDVFSVGVDRLDADLQLDRDLSAGQTLSQKSEYMEFAVGKTRDIEFTSWAGVFQAPFQDR